MRTSAPPQPARSGFSIIEILVVAVLGSVILAAAYGMIAADSHRVALAAASRSGSGTPSAGTELLSAIRTLAPEGAPVPVAAPLRTGAGVGFSFLDQQGGATTVASEVRQIVVTLPAGESPR